MRKLNFVLINVILRIKRNIAFANFVEFRSTIQLPIQSFVPVIAWENSKAKNELNHAVRVRFVVN